MKHLLLTGVPGVGKTTVIQKVAEQLGDRKIRGFITGEIREGGVRKGFSLTPFEGEPGVLSHVDFSSQYRVSKYGVDVAFLDEVSRSLLEEFPPADIYLIDEIGKMECYSTVFVKNVWQLLDGDIPLVATIAQHGGGFIAEVKQRSDIELWEVTRTNRNHMPDRIVDLLTGYLPRITRH